MSEKRGSLWWPELGIWIALMILMAISFGSAYLKLGAGNAVMNYGVAVTKVALVAWVFMHIRSANALLRLTAAASLFWLLVLFVLTWADFLTRT